MKKNLFYLVLMLVLTGVASVNAQVLIGGTTTDNPHAGAILDLASGGQTNMGLLLPKVELSDDASEFTLGSHVTPNPTAAVGMLVYNIADVLDGPGVYLWDGDTWAALGDTCPYTVKDLDGNEYPTGWFGDAGCWMTHNLRYAGNLAVNNSPQGINDKYYAYPEKDNTILNPGKHPEYGRLYTWAAAMNGGNAESSRGICPEKWHIPSDQEWGELISVFDANPTGYSVNPTQGAPGASMKSQVPVTVPTYGSSHPATEGGFDALLVGRVVNGTSPDFGTCAYFWSSSTYGSNYAWRRDLICTGADVHRDNSYKTNLLSVRCKKDN
jgi:uncharacterized protein (TIGR02145 family)